MNCFKNSKQGLTPQIEAPHRLKRSHSFESACRPKTFEAIDEYQRSFKLAVDDGRELIVLGQGSTHEQIGFGLVKPVAIESKIEVG